MKRIIMHWTGGTYQVTDLDREHYHYIVAGDGTVVKGRYKPEANLSVKDGRYAAHTLGCNTGSIGIACAGMAGGTEAYPELTKYPLGEHQILTMCYQVTELCKKYDIDVTSRTVLTHAEVESTLGIKQAGKWDISWLAYLNFRSKEAIGDYLRKQVMMGLMDVAPMITVRVFGKRLSGLLTNGSSYVDLNQLMHAVDGLTCLPLRAGDLLLIHDGFSYRVPPLIQDSNTYVSVRRIAEVLKSRASWDKLKREAVISE